MAVYGKHYNDIYFQTKKLFNLLIDEETCHNVTRYPFKETIFSEDLLMSIALKKAEMKFEDDYLLKNI